MRLVTSKEMTAPTAAKANWPSDSWPPNPVMTPTDKATMAKAKMPVKVTALPLVVSCG